MPSYRALAQSFDNILEKEYYLSVTQYVLDKNTNEWKMVTSRLTHNSRQIIKLPSNNATTQLKQQNSEATVLTQNTESAKPTCFLSSNSELTIEFNQIQISRCKIYDVRGILLYEDDEASNNQRVTVNVNQFAAGAYFVILSTDKSNSYVLSFIKN